MISNYINTVWKILSAPGTFFRVHRVGDRWGPPLLFGLVSQFIAYLALFLYQIFLSFIPTAFLAALGHFTPEDFFQTLALPVVLIILVIALPFFGFFAIVFSTGLYHFVLWILRGNRGGLKSTFDAVCYSQAAQVVMLVPILGSLVAGIWQIVLLIIGLKELHKISTGKSILTVLLPIIVCCGLIFCLMGFVFVSFIIPLIKQHSS